MAVDVFEFEEDIPVIECRADGTFTLSVTDVNAGKERRELTGTFTVNGDEARFTPAGETAPAFTMTLISKTEMRYAGDGFYSVTRGDIFTKNS